MAERPSWRSRASTPPTGRRRSCSTCRSSWRRGEIVALMGRNGAGKSTTLKAIMGLVPAQAPRAALCRPRHPGHAELPHRPARARLRAGGAAHLHRPHRLREPGGRRQGGGRREPRGRGRPSGCSRSSPTSPRCAAARASQMSGGEQQMLTIARTLMGNPEAVLLDEPSEGLAPVIVEQMAAAVRRMKAEGIAVLLSEQNLHFASRRRRPHLHHREGRHPPRGPHGRHRRRRGAARGLPDGLKAPRTSGPVRPMRCPCAPALRPPDGASPPASPRCRRGAGRGG